MWHRLQIVCLISGSLNNVNQPNKQIPYTLKTDFCAIFFKLKL